MSTQRFAGKVMVVTGAAQGIGRAVALRAAVEGAKVLFVDRADFVSEVATEAKGTEAVGFVADLETYEGAASAMAFAVRQFGGIDILMPTLYACHSVLPHLLKRGSGTIVNISSNATRGIRRVPYSAAKGGVNAMTQSLAMEYAEHNIRVVATAPGGTDAPPRRVPRNTAGDSEQEKVWMGDAVKQVTESTFFKRYGSIDEQVAPILFLASDEASYITGTVLPVAGGDTG
jgi:dihydroxycyclohexadiene carboxylate dehydrogenase